MNNVWSVYVYMHPILYIYVWGREWERELDIDDEASVDIICK